MSLLTQIREGAYTRAAQFVSRTALVSGQLRESGTQFRCLFVGDTGLSEYLSAKMYREPPEVLSAKRLWIPALKKMLTSTPAEMDLCIAVLPQQYHQDLATVCDFHGTEHVEQAVDLQGSWEEIRSRFHKNKKQLSNTIEKKFGCAAKFTNDPADFDLFYHSLYQPHILRKFDGFQELDSYEEMRPYFDRGVLLLVLEHGRPIAGALSVVEGETLMFRRTGAAEDGEIKTRRAAQSALYYYSLRWAHERGLKRFNAMKSRAFLNDGVYVHKREWGASVVADPEATTGVYFFNLTKSEGAAAFFEENPAIVHGADGLMGVTRAPAEKAGPELEESLAKQFGAPGLRGMLLVEPKDTPARIVAFA